MKSEYRQTKLLLIAVVLTFGGCSLHAPASETIVFEKNLPNVKGIMSALNSSAPNNSVSKTFFTKKFVEKHREKDPESDNYPLNKLWEYGIGYYSLFLKFDDNFAISLNPALFINAGADFTYHMGDDFYITGIANIQSSGEVILQKKIFDDINMQGSLGLAFRREQQSTDFAMEASQIEFITVNMTGIRYAMNIKLFRNNIGLNAGLYYESNYNTPVVNAGIIYRGIF
jgi:hypothetical protein